ncbi:hypothetical protein D3C78_1774320 [compost metagenome]
MGVIGEAGVLIRGHDAHGLVGQTRLVFVGNLLAFGGDVLTRLQASTLVFIVQGARADAEVFEAVKTVECLLASE